MQSLDLSHEGVQYYAHSVMKSRVFQVSRRAEEDRYLHLVCFVTHQYRRTQDTLVDLFLQVTTNTVNTCKREHQEKYFEERAERRRSMRSFADSVRRHVINPLSEIETVAFNEGLDTSERLRQIQAILNGDTSERKQVEERTGELRGPSIRDTDEADYFSFLESRSVKL